MLNRRILSRAVIAAVALQSVALAGNAWAHHPNIEASVACDTETGTPVISYTSTSWSPDPLFGENPQVDILFDGVVVGTGAYVYPANAFSGSGPAPAGAGPGDSVIVTAVAVGVWGDGAAGGQSASTTVTLPPDSCEQPGLGRFTGGGSQIKVDGVRVTRGLTIHCDLLLSNNLQVNWGGNKFHMTEHLTTVACTDDPNIQQEPPVAPLDTLIGVGTGRYNNHDGYTIEFTLVDAGEPGVNDQMRILIYEAADPAHVVLDVPLQYLTGGNLQAHFDQPHK